MESAQYDSVHIVDDTDDPIVGDEATSTGQKKLKRYKVLKTITMLLIWFSMVR